MSTQSINSPTRNEVHRAYLAPETPEHWERIQRLVLTGGFGVEPNPHNLNKTVEKNGQPAPEFRVTWPTPELEAQDHQIFFKACQMVMGTLHLDDEVYSYSTLPRIFQVLEESYLFTQLFSKVSASQNNTVRHHIETVPTLVITAGENMRDRFILRITAIFHDIGKSFNIGRDQVHYHALIASNIVSWFMEQYNDQFINNLFLVDKRLDTQVLIDKQHGGEVTREALQIEFTEVKNQITEIIRLHHVLEQIDKGVLDLQTVAEIFKSKGINPLTFGLFAIADGSSVIPDNAKYAEFLISNLNALAQLVDLMEFQDLLKSDGISLEIKQTFAQSLQFVIREVIATIAGLPEKVQKIIREIAEKIDVVLATALLSLNVQEAYP
ncbi:hypothetical protein KA017_02020 [Candidatus Woesebacteria bacterium]|nr:hypothetical protein [Candidatus Woesebacteria bacterium]